LSPFRHATLDELQMFAGAFAHNEAPKDRALADAKLGFAEASCPRNGGSLSPVEREGGVAHTVAEFSRALRPRSGRPARLPATYRSRPVSAGCPALVPALKEGAAGRRRGMQPGNMGKLFAPSGVAQRPDARLATRTEIVRRRSRPCGQTPPAGVEVSPSSMVATAQRDRAGGLPSHHLGVARVIPRDLYASTVGRNAQTACGLREGSRPRHARAANSHGAMAGSDCPSAAPIR